MSGDVQPRKRKDKRRKKDVSNVPADYRAEKTRVVLEDTPVGEDVGSSSYSSDETIHIYKDRGTGGNICAKIVFFLLLGALAVMVGLIVMEYRGSSDVDTPVAESRWAQVFDGWVDESPPKHEEHDEPVEESGEHDEEHSEETEGAGDDGHDELEEVGSQEEQSQEEEIGSEEAQSPEEEEEEEEEEEAEAEESEEGQEEEEAEERQEEDKEEVEEEEEQEEQEEEEEEEEEEESSEEILEGIPGVTESDEDDQDEEEEDESAGAEGGDDVSEEATREEEEARRKSTVAPVTETSPKLPVHAPGQAGETLSEKSQGIPQSKDRPVTVASKGRKEAPDQEIKSEEIKRESANQLEDESSAHPQAAQSDVANKGPEKSVRGASVTQDIPTSYGRDEKVVISQRSSGTTSSKSSTTTEKPAVQHTPTEKPTVQHIPSEKPTVQHSQTEQSSVLHTSAEKPTVQYIPTEKPAVQHIPGDQPTAEHIPTEKQSVRHTLPAEQPTVQHSPTEKPGLPHTSAENPSTQEPPLAVVHPKTTSQSAHASDLREDKLELTIPEKVAGVLSHSEHSESVDVKPASSQTSSKVQEDGTNHDTKQQQKEAEVSQKAHTTSREPDSTIQSAGKVPKEASVAADKSTSRISETRKNGSRTSATKHKKEEAGDSGEGDGDKDDDDSVEEAVGEEVGREDAEDDKESGRDDDSAGVGDDDEDEPSGVALKFGVGVALVLVAHVVLVRKWNADDGTTVQPAVSTQASDTEHGVEEITPELIERRQTLIPQDDLEGSEYSEEEEGEEEEEEKPQKTETYEDYMTKYRPQALTKKEPAKEVKRVLPADSEEGEEENSDEEEDEEEEESEGDEEPARRMGTTLQKSARATHITPEASGTEEEGSEEEEVVPVRRATKSSGEQGYVRADISSKDDLKIREDLDLADAQLEEDLGN